jgi:DNA polymerase-3 subunit alpha
MEWTDKQRLDEEKSVLGFYFSGHPLAEARELVEGLSSKSIKGLSEIPEGYEVLLGAYVTNIRVTITKAKGEKMAILTIEDFSGSTQAVVFPRTYDKFKELIQPDRILFFRGKIKADMNSGGGANGAQRNQTPGEEAPRAAINILPDEILTVEAAAERYTGSLMLSIGADGNGNGAEGKSNGNGSTKAKVQSLAALMQNHRGKVPVYFSVELDEGPGSPATVTIRGGQKIAIRPDVELFAGLRGILKPGSIRVTGDNTRAQKAAVPAWKQRQNNANNN